MAGNGRIRNMIPLFRSESNLMHLLDDHKRTNKKCKLLFTKPVQVKVYMADACIKQTILFYSVLFGHLELLCVPSRGFKMQTFLFSSGKWNVVVNII